MGGRGTERGGWAGTAWVALAAIGVGLLLRLPGWGPGDLALRAGYDGLHGVTGVESTATARLPVALVYLDLHSHLQLGIDPSRPWPRALHARLLRRLQSEGARAVVFDVVFGGAGADASADRDLAAAMREWGKVVIAGQASDTGGQYTTATEDWVRWLRVEEPEPGLAAAAAGWGLANHRVDEDLVVRRLFAGLGEPFRPSLALAALGVLLPGEGGGRGRDARSAAMAGWMRYYGPALSLPHVSYVQALEPGGVPDGFFRDRVVFVGARPMADQFAGRQDAFRGPFHGNREGDLFHPGVEVHATQFLNLWRGDWLMRTGRAVEIGWTILAGLMAAVAACRWKPVAGAIALGLGAVVVVGVSMLGFARGFWFPWAGLVLGVLPVAWLGGWGMQLRDWRVTRRRLEAERRAAEARIREQATLIDAANDAIVLAEPGGRVRLVNPAAERLYGWTGAEFAAGRVTGLDLEPAVVAAAHRAVRETGSWRGDLRQRHRSGRALLVESRWTLLRDETGAARGVLMMGTDVTEWRQAELEARRLQRTEAVGALASGMAHDLNNALAPVLMGVQLLRRENVGAEARRILEVMEGSTLRGAGMVRQVVTFARGTGSGAEVVDVRGMIREMERLVRDTFPRGIEVAAHVAGDVWSVRGNATEIHQVLLNLCVNARDAMPGRGRLDLAADNLAGFVVEAGGGAGDWVSILVSDTGSGIPPDVLPRIFEPFFTTKEEGKGTGLGLSTTARIVKAHGGVIRVDSRPGEGTTFEVLLPRWHAGSDVDSEPKAAGELPRGAGERILVVDDDRAVLELLERSLVDHGYSVVTGAGAEEAVAAAAREGAALGLVLCDRSMPGRAGGTVAEEVRGALPAGVAWVWLSGDGAEADGQAGGTPSGTCLRKPFSLEGLLREVRRALDAGVSGARAGGVSGGGDRP